MNVLWLSHLIPFPPVGGAPQRSYHLLRHVAARHRVHLVAFRQVALHSTERSVAEARRVLSTFCASVDVVSIPSERSVVHRAAAMLSSVLGRQPYDVRWLSSRQARRRVAALRRTTSFDLVHVDTIGLWPYAAPFRDTPRLLSHHNVESALQQRRAMREPSRWRAAVLRRDAGKLRRLERDAGTAAAVNVVVSEREARELRRIAPGARVAVVENGVDLAYWRSESTPAERPHRVVFAGSLGWFANRDAVQWLLREIWPELARRGTDRELWLVGRDPSSAARAAASADRRIHVTGALPDVRPSIAAAQVYVCPIRVGGGTRLKVLDALAMRIPMVATGMAVDGLDLVDGEHYLRAESPQEFVHHVERLFDDPDLRRRMGMAGRQLVERRFDWALVAPKLDAAYALAVGDQDR